MATYEQSPSDDLPDDYPLHTAVEEGDFDTVAELVDQGADVNLRNEQLCTPLHLAAQQGHLDLVKYLIQRYADIDARAAYGEQPLLMAITSRWGARADPDVVRFLVNSGADIRATDDDGWTPLYAAAERGALSVAEVLLKAGAPVDQPTTFGDTPLHRAVRRPDVQMSEFLLKNGADLWLPDDDGQSAAQIIEQECRGPSYKGSWYREDIRTEMLRIIQEYPDANDRGTTQRDLVDSLKASGLTASVHYPNARSPEQLLVIAAAQGDLDTVQDTLRSGVSANASLQGGVTALMAVCTTSQINVAKALLAAGANPNCTDSRGVTPVMGAAFAGQIPMVKLLLQSGGDLELRSNEGFTALELAKNQGHLAVAEMLQQASAKAQRDGKPWWKPF